VPVKKLSWKAAVVALSILGALYVLATSGNSGDSSAVDEPAAVVPIETVSSDRLPLEALRTLHLIDEGGPFPYSRDGSVFHNYEGLLPEKPDGYYREYTVVTPGSSDRGARRIVVGAGSERYYTDDHYATFRLIVE